MGYGLHRRQKGPHLEHPLAQQVLIGETHSISLGVTDLRAVSLKLQCVHKSPGALVKMQILISVGLGWSL